MLLPPCEGLPRSSFPRDTRQCKEHLTGPHPFQSGHHCLSAALTGRAISCWKFSTNSQNATPVAENPGHGAAHRSSSRIAHPDPLPFQRRLLSSHACVFGVCGSLESISPPEVKTQQHFKQAEVRVPSSPGGPALLPPLPAALTSEPTCRASPLRAQSSARRSSCSACGESESSSLSRVPRARHLGGRAGTGRGLP